MRRLVLSVVLSVLASGCVPAADVELSDQSTVGPAATSEANASVDDPSSVDPTRAPVPVSPEPKSNDELLAPVVGFTEQWTVELRGELPQTVLPDERDNGVLYVAAKTGGVYVVGVDGARIASVSREQLGGNDAMNVAQQGDLVVVALGDFFAQAARVGVALLDVRDPTAPEVVSVWTAAEELEGIAAIAVSGENVYLAAMEHGVIVIDISDRAVPRELVRFVPDLNFPTPNPGDIARPNARGLAIVGSLLYVAFDAGGLRVVDVGDPSGPVEIGRHINAGPIKQQAYNDVVVAGGVAYVGADYCGFEAIDISDPTAMQTLDWLDPWDCNSAQNLWFNSPGHLNQVVLDQRRNVVWVSAGDSELLAIDVSDPSDLSVAAVHGAPGNGRGTYGLGAAGDHVYLTYITTIIPFQGRFAGVVAVSPIS